MARFPGPYVRLSGRTHRYFEGMRRNGKVMRPALRFLASVLITSGILMLVDAALTVTWQEPVSGFFAQRNQDKLDDELGRDAPQVQRDLRSLASIRGARERLKRLAE